MELWTDKYRPGSVGGILSQNKAVEATLSFLSQWKPGKALLFYGPPGTGKTLLAETVARERGWMLTALNASDKRNTDAIESQMLESSKNRGLFSKGRLILIDEIDGLSGNSDRGGAQAVIKVIKESKFPVILTANDPYSSKLKSLRRYCKMVKFSKVHALSIAKRLREICESEGISVRGDVLKNLARWSSGDMRSALADLQGISQRREEIGEDDLLSLGYRERKSNVFEILPAVFKSGNPRAARKAIYECDKDPDEIFWWIESNVHSQFRDPSSLAMALDMLSRADLYRQKVMKQQNWAFKGYMVDLMSGVSLSGETASGFVPFNPPKRLVMLGRSKSSRAKMKPVIEKIGAYTHSSGRVVRREYIPLLRIMLGKGTVPREGMELTEDEGKTLISG